MNNLAGSRYVLIAYVAIGGQSTLILWRAAALFSALNAFEASIRSTASVSSASMMMMIIS